MVLKISGVATRDHAQFILRLVFFVTLPALAFLSIASQAFSSERLLLPVAAIIVNLACTGLALAYIRRAAFDGKTAGAIVLSAGVANVAFVIPFVEYGLGTAALASVVLYDVGNAVFVATGSNLMAARFGGTRDASLSSSLATISRTPLLIAVVVALLMSATGLRPWDAIRAALDPIAGMTAPLVLIAMGALVTTIPLTRAAVIATVAIRMLVGLAAGIAVVLILNPKPFESVAILAAAAAPVGFNAVTLASIHKLDVDVAAAALFLSVLCGLLTTTAFVHFIAATMS